MRVAPRILLRLEHNTIQSKRRSLAQNKNRRLQPFFSVKKIDACDLPSHREMGVAQQSLPGGSNRLALFERKNAN